MDEKVSGTALPSKHHVVRTVGKTKWDFVETSDGVILVVDDEEFLPRPDHPPGTGPEEYVSVDYLEYFSGNLRQQLNQVRDSVAARRRNGKVGKQARLATVLVADIHRAADSGNKAVVVATTGDASDPSHSGIYGLDPDDHLISQKISNACITYPAYESPG